jgi:hypothetical protein
MEAAIGISAARWVVSRALGPITSGLLEPWAASSSLGTKIHELKMELLYAQGMLDNARGRDVRSPALAQLLLELRQLAYLADDVLDELEYFRIQDEINGTYETTEAEGLTGLLIHAQHTVKTHARKLKPPSCSWPASCHGDKFITSSVGAVGKRLPCYSLPSSQNNARFITMAVPLDVPKMPTNGRRFPCGIWPSKAEEKKHILQSPALNFDRVGMSKKMSDIVEQLKPICAKVSTILSLELFGFIRTTTTPENPFVRPKTTSEIMEPKIYGRETQLNNIIYDISYGKYSTKEGLTVLPIFGLAGIGKTTFTQHIYNKVKAHFNIRIWICVSLNFNANRLAQEILKQIPECSGENVTAQEKIEKAIQSEKFLFVLDDVWKCPMDEWNKLLSPFRKGRRKGNMVIVTTRFLGVASAVESTDCSIKLEHLEPRECMALFEACVFGDQQPWKDHDGLYKTGEEIVKKLKGSPLAVKTVGRLLRTQRNIDHWNSILESKEWELQTSDEDIMPALNLSYTYIPFPVQQCFSYCGLFPEDYKFRRQELIHLWIGLGLLYTSNQNKKIEYTGEMYLDILVDHGFFEKVEGLESEEMNPCYVIHDLLHDLAVKVSSYECLSINISNVRAITIPASIRHLSIIVDNTVVTDKTTFKKFMSDLATLGKKLKAENLHTLMLFGFYHGRFIITLHDLFKKAKALRVISLFQASYNVEALLENFSNLVHLRYLRLGEAANDRTMVAKSISRFYHLMVLNVGGCWEYIGYPIYVGNLVNLRHYIGQGPSIAMVGKLKVLQELRGFGVRRETSGFELEQLGQLLELGGSLRIFNLENVQSIEEVEEAKLTQKKNLHSLILAWGTKICDNNGPSQKDVLENLKPHRNLRVLRISRNGGATCPSWLDGDLNLEELELEDVSWNKLPLLGKLCMARQHGRECRGCVTSQGFQNLKTLTLVNLPRLKKWCGNGTCHLLSNLESLIVRDCSQLIELPFSGSPCHERGQLETMAWFPKLLYIEICFCPNLLHLPTIPWTNSKCQASIQRVGNSDLKGLLYVNEIFLRITGKGARDSSLWNVLAFGNLTKLRKLEIEDCSPMPLHRLQVLKSLEQLSIKYSSNVLLPTERQNNVLYQFPIKQLTFAHCGTSGKELTQMLAHFPYLCELSLINCRRVSGLGVAVEKKPWKATTSANRTGEAEIRPYQRGTTEGQLVLFPPHIHSLSIIHCPQLSYVSTSIGKGTSAGVGLQDLRSLQSLDIMNCPMLFSSNLSFYFLFPTSLQTLSLDGSGTETSFTLPPLPNLTNLHIKNAPGLIGENCLPLLSQGRLTELSIDGAPKFLIGLEPTRLYGIRTVRMEELAGFFCMPICRVLSSSLTNLFLYGNTDLERFSKDHEKAIGMLTSLEVLEFSDHTKLQSGPAGLSGLLSLKRLAFCGCPALQYLPKDSIPSSLQELTISYCPQLRSLPKDGIQNSSLRELVLQNVSMELSEQCRKLKETIPVIEDTFIV